MRTENAEKYVAKTLAEYRKRSDSIAKRSELKDGERKIVIRPGFDLRNTEDRQYGQDSPTLIFMERRGNIAIDAGFGTGWQVKGQAHLSIDGEDISMMGYGFYFHRLYKKDVKYPEYAHREKHCPLLGDKPCWGEAGSALYGDELKWILLNYGEDGIWDEIDKAFKEYGL